MATLAETNKTLVRKVMQLLNVEHNIDEAVDKYYAKDFIEHDPGAGTGAEAIRTFFKQFFKDYPQATLDVKHMIAEGDFVAIHFAGKLKPEDRGVAGVEIYRITNGRLAEHWQVIQEIPESSLNTNGMV